jgi:hypothetical protein
VIKIMSLSRSSSSISSVTSPTYDNDLFKKFKLKHHRTVQSTYENDDQMDMNNNSDEWTSRSSTPELDVEPHFEDYYIQRNPHLNNARFHPHFLTPDIDELQRKEKELLRSLNTFQQQVKF